jgi:hypothetical protein
MKTLQEVKKNVQEIINNTDCTATKLEALQALGYTVTYKWIKGGGIGVSWYIRRKNCYRIQVSASELHGKYFKAYCIEVPA